MRKIVFIGGGSAKFVREIVTDLFSYEELHATEIVLMDINAERIGIAERLVQKMIAERKMPARVSATLDRREALAGADYVIVTIMVGGLECYRQDVAIPEKYGVLQAISDTTGPGGVMRILRTYPVLAGLAADLAAVAPDALVLNYANPMSMNTRALLDCGHTRTIGLCHSIQWGPHVFSRYLDIPPEEIEYTAGGINHINFYLTLTHKGRDLYPLLLERAEAIIAKRPTERLRLELLAHLGHFPAEGPDHQAEYYAWFAKDRETLAHYGTEPYLGYKVDKDHMEIRFKEIEQQIAGTLPFKWERSVEYGVRIIHSLETGREREFYGNVVNDGLIDNLPPEAIVEVPCTVDGKGIRPRAVGRIPDQLAAVMLPHVHLQRLALAGVRERAPELIRQAIQADPLTGAICTLPQIRAMTDELLAANTDYLADWPDVSPSPVETAA